jgi:hypothetical protein
VVWPNQAVPAQVACPCSSAVLCRGERGGEPAAAAELAMQQARARLAALGSVGPPRPASTEGEKLASPRFCSWHFYIEKGRVDFIPVGDGDGDWKGSSLAGVRAAVRPLPVASEWRRKEITFLDTIECSYLSCHTLKINGSTLRL